MSQETNYRPPRAGKHYTEDEVFAIINDMYNLSTAEIALKTERTIPAIHGLFQSEGISPYTFDGSYTAAEISRRTNIPMGTLVEWLKQGKIPAKKKGKFWRIEWDGESPIAPQWSGKTLHLLEPRIIEGQNEGLCVNCSFPLNSRDARLWCSKKCQSEDMHLMSWERRSKKESPLRQFPPFMRPRFQDFLASDSMRVLIRKKSFHHTRELKFKQDAHLTPMQTKLLTIVSKPGILFPYDFVVRNLYGEIPENWRSKLDYSVYRVRAALEEPNNFFAATNIGLGLGIKGLEMSRQELIVLNSLWLKSGHFVPAEFIVPRLFGDNPVKGDAAERIIDIVRDLRADLAGRSYSVTQKQFYNWGVRKTTPCFKLDLAA